MELDQLLSRTGDMLSAGRVFGTPVERDGVTLVPVAWVLGGGGGGTGDDASPGDGAGFGLISIPIGAYVIKDGNVRFTPTYDVGLLAVLGVGLARKLIGRRRRRR